MTTPQRIDETLVPPSWPQRKFLRALEVRPDDPTATLVRLFQLPDDLDLAKLRRAIDEALAATPANAVDFTWCGSEIWQRWVPGRTPTADIVPIADEPGDAPAIQLACQWQEHVFRADDWPLLRVQVLTKAGRPSHLLFAASHLVSDARSASLLCDLLAARYDQTADPEISDYWDALESATGGDLAEAHDYFARQLAGAESLELTEIARPRQHGGQLPGRRVTWTLSHDQARRIKDAGRALRVTPNGFFMAIYALLLARATGSGAVVLGLPVSTRRSQAEMGYHVNTLPVRLDVAKAETFVDLCHEAQVLTFAALRRRLVDYSLPEVSALGGVVNNFFSLHGRQPGVTLGGRQLRPVPLPCSLVGADFSLVVGEQESADGATFSLIAELNEWWADVDLESVVEHLVSWALDHPREPLADAALVALDDLAERPLPPAPRETFVEAFAARVSRHPERIAIVAGDERISYAALNRRSDGVAALLRDARSSHGRAVVCVRRGVDDVTAALGALKAGLAYVPVDPDRTGTRLAQILDDLGDVALLCDAAGEALAAGDPRVRVIRVDGPLPEAGPAVRPCPQDAAYQIYTSGSTGRPKGVVVTHGALLSFLQAAQQSMPYDDGSRVLRLHSLAFDASVWEIFRALYCGGTVAVASYDESRNPQAIAALLTSGAVDHALVTPSAMSGAARCLQGAAGAPIRLKTLALGAEALHPGLVRTVREVGGDGFQLFNAYGPTECTVACALGEITDEDARRESPLPIGEPLENTRAQIVDPDLRPVPTGIPGELLVSGPALAQGYFARDDVTLTRFLDAPAGGAGQRCYRTGDKVMRARDGRLVHLGRFDAQVKLRGFRIELGEIESVVERTLRPAECRACVVDTGSEQHLVALVVAPRNSTVGVRAQLRKSLPTYSVPERILEVDALPLTTSAKLDTDAVRHLLATQSTTAERRHDGDLVARLRGHVAAVVGYNEFDTDESFFDVGLNSVQVIELHERVSADFPESGITITDLFRFCTLAALAERIRPARLRVPRLDDQIALRLERQREARENRQRRLRTAAGSMSEERLHG